MSTKQHEEMKDEGVCPRCNERDLCRDVLRGLADNSIDSVVTDPPYALVSIQKRFGKPGSAPAKDVYGRGAAGFMGKQWDTGEVAFSDEFWAEVLRVLKPGGHVVAFSGTRTYHRMAVAIEDAGFEIRDQLGWVYGSGFPKSHNQHGDWEGWGTALKPAWEPIALARKPLTGTVAANLADWGVGAINVDGCRVETDEKLGGGAYAAQSKGRAAWAVKDGQFFGVAQRRRRVLVVADFGNGADPATVLFEPESVFRDTPPSREAGKDVAPTISARTKGGVGLGTDFDLDGGLVQHAPEIARCDATREGSSQDFETTTMVAVGVTGDVAHTLKAEGADASEDGTGRGTPIIAFTAINDGGDASADCTPTLTCGGGGGQGVAMSVAIRGRDGGATAELGGDIATALRASQGGGDKPHVLVDGLPETAGTMKACAQSGGFSNSADHAAAGYMVPVTTSAVRRLTPVECERLQGFPDNYTDIPWRGKANSPDGLRYKALGNSWAVPKFVWLGQRIQKLMPANDNQETPIANAA